jgi:hypothetical protein
MPPRPTKGALFANLGAPCGLQNLTLARPNLLRPASEGLTNDQA